MPEIGYTPPLWADDWLRPDVMTPKPPRPLVLPVIHVPDGLNAMMPKARDVCLGFSLRQAEMAFETEADGVFVISHPPGQDQHLPGLGRRLKDRWPDKLVGVNMLYTRPSDAAMLAGNQRLDMVWLDDCGISSSGTTEETRLVQRVAALRGITVFAGVAFKGQIPEPRPSDAARTALEAGFVPTTSGVRTGVPPEVGKIASMSPAANGWLAVASGMTPENVAEYVPHLSHILVATGVCVPGTDAFDPVRMRRFVTAVRSA